MKTDSATGIAATGVILAGGESRRFGGNKAMADWHGRPMIAKIAADVAAICDHTLLVSNTPEEFSFLGWRTVADIRPGYGPLAGLEAALAASDTNHIFLTGCDLPCLSGELIRYLFSRRADSRAVIPTGPGGIEPLCAVYRRDLLPEVSGLLDQGELRLRKLAEMDGILFIDAKETSTVAPGSLIFANANRPGELERIREASAQEG